jgi:SAM-dependent methyltransferase
VVDLVTDAARRAARPGAGALVLGMSSDPTRHSEAFLNDLRDGWWNADFLQLVARRLALDTVRDALDVGAGQGHWTRVVAGMLSPDARVVGVEREPDWVAEANRRARPNQTFVQGSAEALPFPDASFDLVTCQTLLIHVADPAVVLAEMWRVLRPGGRLMVAEPNNLANMGSWAVQLPGCDVEDALEAMRLEIMVERGKAALGEGHNSTGEVLVGLLRDGWDDIRSWVDDRTRQMSPPYDPAIVAQERAFHDKGQTGWTRAEAARWFAAAGGTDAAFERAWGATLKLNGLRLAAIDAGTYSALEGGLHYVIAARKVG